MREDNGQRKSEELYFPFTYTVPKTAFRNGIQSQKQESHSEALTSKRLRPVILNGGFLLGAFASLLAWHWPWI